MNKKILTRNKLASEIAKIEGGKSQARIGDLRQVLKIISKLKKENRFTWKIFK